MNILFTDEFRFNPHSSYGRFRSYWRRNEFYEACAIQKILSFGGGSVVVWNGIFFHTRKELHVFDAGYPTTQGYWKDIPEPYIVPFGSYIGEIFVLMHENP